MPHADRQRQRRSANSHRRSLHPSGIRKPQICPCLPWRPHGTNAGNFADNHSVAEERTQLISGRRQEKSALPTDQFSPRWILVWCCRNSLQVQASFRLTELAIASIEPPSSRRRRTRSSIIANSLYLTNWFLGKFAVAMTPPSTTNGWP